MRQLIHIPTVQSLDETVPFAKYLYDAAHETGMSAEETGAADFLRQTEQIWTEIWRVIQEMDVDFRQCIVYAEGFIQAFRRQDPLDEQQRKALFASRANDPAPEARQDDLIWALYDAGAHIQPLENGGIFTTVLEKYATLKELFADAVKKSDGADGIVLDDKLLDIVGEIDTLQGYRNRSFVSLVNTTLPESAIGVLVLGASHAITSDLDPDIVVTSLSPKLDELTRQYRELSLFDELFGEIDEASDESAEEGPRLPGSKEQGY